MSLIVPDDLEQAARERERAIDAAEEQLADAVGEATRELLSRMQKASRSSLTASSPQLPRMASQLFTYGQVAGWWDTALDQNVMAVVQRIWQNGRSSASDATMSSGSFDSVGDYVSAVKDRLSRTATPTIPDDAFNTVREALVDEMARGSTGRQTAERLAAELRWQGQDVGFWKRRQAEAERQIERMLDAAGPKYTTDDRGRRIENPVRKDMRLNDPTVRQYQRELSDATSHLDKDRSVWQTRAERIARTETTAAYNAGSQNAYTEEGAGAKMWIAIADERTREDHLEAHGQCVPTDAAFTVGGEQLLFPGDPSGMGYQVINCRCTTVAADSCEELTAMAEEVGAPIRREREERGEPEPDREPSALSVDEDGEPTDDLLTSNARRFYDEDGEITGVADEEQIQAARFSLDDMKELNPDLEDHLGTRFTGFALDEEHTRVAYVDGAGVAGAVGYTSPRQMDDLVELGITEPVVRIEYVGSTGIAEGAGSALTVEVIKEAALSDAAILLEPANAGAEEFFTRVGMRADPHGVGADFMMGLTADDVKRLAEGF